MRPSTWLTLTLSLFSTLALANEQQTFTDSANWAKQAAGQALTPNALPLNIDDYCKDAACREERRNPKQSKLSDSDINAQKGTAFVTNGLAQDINANFNKGRPDVKSDPAMRFALLGQENAFEVTHGISNAYVDCDNATQCVIDYIPKQCQKPTYNSVPCTKTPTFTPHISAVIYSCPSGWSRNGMVCKKVTQECRYDSRNYVERSCGDYSFHWQGAGFGFWKSGHSRYRSEQGCGRENGTDYREKYQICGRIEHSQPVKLSCRSSYTLSGGNCVKNTLTWKTQCTLLKECKVVSQTCVEGRSTRTINGIPTTLNCWKYQVNHQCDRPDTCAALPKDCTTQAQHCSLKQNGVCIEQEVTKSCAEKTCRATNMQCGEQSFCLDGECYVPEPKLNGNFDKSVAALAGLAEAVKDIGDPPKIFTGKPMKCSKKLAGFNDCCKDSGWGQDLGAKCSEAEEALGEAKEKGLTLYVGQYCAKKVLGVCTRKKRSYCVYDNKLAKIIQEQGSIQQLGKRLGSAKNPTCAAITPEELGQINFEYIDFKEFYPDMHDNTNLPNFDEIKKRLQSATGG
ncbi:type-F conjugative transfer system mating-pair stabilization protein TraN [Vibrio anguillarum]|uniref:type-F conjugative transfer system mating-pair stabilization protein TraN n=1 Tax=Vibrio anguillarum TaxID=55601 RepID=UPI00067EFB43|nr:type-F conjugative transfer system mating-pair stabilization protein TraN [Vibrio anguillarum]KNH10860.1 conjugal transfer protein TraN [Vibrio lentus]MBT2975980.1 type-F conjugative transfer system mating-pair stabilization protein TraN [Vibrio anguillarum]MBT2984030.1 type-F conjugative transfer system mating-pair stabilization protein TraN [Vibrio anguillarum]